MGRLEGKRALVLGAAGKGNMGQTIARRLAAEGARVAVAGRHLEALSVLAAETHGPALLCDIAVHAEIDAMVADTVAALGGLDIALNATGWGLLSPFLDTTGEELDRMNAVHFRGPYQFFQAAIRAMGGGGSIIQISSATATILFHDHAAYMGTKAGIDHVIRAIADEFGRQGIRANSISPGLTDTPMNAAAKDIPGLFDAFVPSYPLGRYGTADDIAAAAVWLASDECFMTGQNLQVNGGLTLRRNPNRDEIAAAIAAARSHA